MASSARKLTQLCSLMSPPGTVCLGGMEPPILGAPSVRRQEWGAHSSSRQPHRQRTVPQVLVLTAFLCFQSMKWCDEGIFLLASQPVDKCQSQDGAEAALQEIEKFLETGAENKIQELNKIYKEYECILNQDLLVMPACVPIWGLGPGNWGPTPWDISKSMFLRCRASHMLGKPPFREL